MGAVLAALTNFVLPKVFGIVDKVVPDKDLALQLKNALQTGLLNFAREEMQAAKEIIVAEARGEGWLQRSWRPITMLTFTGLIVARWLGFTAPGITPDLEVQLLEIVKIGLGGYVIGRSGEKIAREIAPIFKERMSR